MHAHDRIIRNEKVRGSNPLSSTTAIAALTCEDASADAEARLSGGVESEPSGQPSDPIATLIAAHAPSGPDLFRPLPTPSDAAQADWDERRNGPRPAYGDSDFPRGLIPVSGIRCGEYL